MRSSRWLRGLGVGGTALLLMQAVPVGRTNPPVATEVPAAPEARSVLRRACYNCHSNETRWPWYAHVAPASWLAVRDVRMGRRVMNFSEWAGGDPKRQRSALRGIVHHVAQGHMPPWFYVALHPRARLSDGDRAVLREWAMSLARTR